MQLLPPPHFFAKLVLEISLKSLINRWGGAVVANLQRNSGIKLINFNISNLCVLNIQKGAGVLRGSLNHLSLVCLSSTKVAFSLEGVAKFCKRACSHFYSSGHAAACMSSFTNNTAYLNRI